MAPVPIVKLPINVPVQVRPVYVDVVEGQYGAQLRVKGEVKGHSANPKDWRTVYLPVALAADLVRAGWTEQHRDRDGEDQLGYKSPDRGETWWTVTRKQDPSKGKNVETEWAPTEGWPDALDKAEPEIDPDSWAPDDEPLPLTAHAEPADAKGRPPAKTDPVNRDKDAVIKALWQDSTMQAQELYQKMLHLAATSIKQGAPATLDAGAVATGCLATGTSLFIARTRAAGL